MRVAFLNVQSIVVAISLAIVGTASAQISVQASHRQLVVGITCEEGRKRLQLPDFSGLEPEDRKQIYAAIEHCAVEENNQTRPHDPQVVLMLPNPSSAEARDKVFFETIKINDLDKVSKTCRFASEQIMRSTELISH